ncbi:MAG: alpha/beta hydrolase [Leptolyngbyaceae cyanobacterium SM2_3_12]|nr:alpha/beta hydrolase [Leptolyngbyaceae cyanobacterium SM2_3_12]
MTLPSSPDALWLNVSPSFQRFDYKLLGCLVRHVEVAHWAYHQTPDEASSLEIAITLLHDYIKGQNRSIHLVGHGTAGLLGWLYARRYPNRVKSLTLLSVGVNPMLDWQSHYYSQLAMRPWGRQKVLAQMAITLFGHQAQPLLNGWIALLEKDLAQSLSPHSLFRREDLCPGRVPVPLLACGSTDDAIVTPEQLQGWKPWLKPEDRLWQCPGGRHFFHAVYPPLVANQILGFWGDTSFYGLPVVELEAVR